jgi:hypothetical protein
VSTLTKAAILAASDAEITIVDVPEWGGSVGVRVMSGKQRDGFEAAIVARRGKNGDMQPAGLRALLVALAACDDAGRLLFDESDIPALEAKSATALQRVFDAAAALNGLAPGSGDEARADFTPSRR